MQYPDVELEAALKEAFVDKKADYIYIDNRRERFLLASAGFGISRGWLVETVHQIDEQSTYFEYRLTPLGRTHFGLQ